MSKTFKASADIPGSSPNIEIDLRKDKTKERDPGMFSKDTGYAPTGLCGSKHAVWIGIQPPPVGGPNKIIPFENNIVVAFWANDTSGAYGYYDDNTTLRDTYGMLYNWYAVDNSSSRYICPEGWHVPTASSNSWCNAEFNCLRTYLGGVVAGGKMKETGTAHWESENAGTSNSSGFTARGSGYRWYSSGTYGGLKEKSYFWTAFAPNSSHAHFREMWYNSNDLGSGQTIQSMGYSVRCLKD
jgi:uncharacterized protein (TIGR02145 family)